MREISHREVYALVDINNCYVSCERLFNPKLIDKPVVVLSTNVLVFYIKWTHKFSFTNSEFNTKSESIFFRKKGQKLLLSP